MGILLIALSAADGCAADRLCSGVATSAVSMHHDDCAIQDQSGFHLGGVSGDQSSRMTAMPWRLLQDVIACVAIPRRGWLSAAILDVCIADRR